MCSREDCCVYDSSTSGESVTYAALYYTGNWTTTANTVVNWLESRCACFARYTTAGSHGTVGEIVELNPGSESSWF